MYLLRVQAIINGQPQLLKQVAVYYEDTVTSATIYDAITEQVISNVLKTDASGFISFKVEVLIDLVFKLLTGLTQSSAYPLFNASAAPPLLPSTETEIQLPCAEMIVEGYAVKTNILNQLERCSADDLADLHKLIGLAKQTGNIGDVIAVVEEEFMTNTAWNWVPQKPIFLGTDGTLTQDLIGVLFVQQVGVAITSTKIVIRISQPIKRA